MKTISLGRFVIFIGALAFVLGLPICLFVSSCKTPTQNAAIATAEAGNAYATYELGKSVANLKGLQDLAAALPLMPLGKVSAEQLGVINAELTAALNTTAGGTQINNQIGSLIALVSQSEYSAGGPETAEQGVLVAQATDVAGGILNGIQFWQGQQSVLHPASP